MRRRAQIDHILGWIFFVLALVVLLVFLYQVIKPLFWEPDDTYNCAAQVLAHKSAVELEKGDNVLISTPDIVCPTREVDFKSGVKDAEVENRIAKEMKLCWDEWGQGKYVLFDEDGIYCHICSVIRFEDKDREILGLKEYLLTTPVPQLKNVTYMEYFTPDYMGTRFTIGDEGKKVSSLREQRVDPTPMPTNQDYAIIFYHARGEKQVDLYFTKVSQDMLTRTGAAAGTYTGFTVGGAAAGATIGYFVLCGLVTEGACWLVVGGSMMVGTTVGAMGGIPSAFVMQKLVDNPPNHAAMLMFRPLNADEVDNLGCEYSFAKRR